MAAGHGAVLSHASAAYFWQLLPYPAQTRDVHVTLPGRKRRPRPGLVIHSPPLPRAEYCIRDGIPVTQVPRTLLDLATHAPRHELESAVNEAYAHRHCSRPQLEAAITRHPGRAGTVALAAAVGVKVTRSDPERRLLRAVLASGLPAPETNTRIGGLEVDMLWRDAGLVVEVDAWSTHGSKTAFEADRRRDERLAGIGISVLRVTAAREPAEAVASIRDALAALRPRRTAGSA